MKAKTIFIAAVLSIQISTLFAANEFPPVTSNNDVKATCCVISLMPTVPAEAPFDEEVVLTDYAGLEPVTPMEASFEDMPAEMTSIIGLVPVTPAFADFDDDDVVVAFNNGVLAPVTPAEADFE